jgi:Ni/Co efflux regulator RcnB
MKRVVSVLLLGSLAASSAALAGTAPNWATRPQQPAAQPSADTQDSRDFGTGRRDNGKRNGASDVQRVPPGRNFQQSNPADSSRGERRYARDPRPNFNSDDSRREENHDSNRQDRDDRSQRDWRGDRDGNRADNDRGERRNARDPRPNFNSGDSRRDDNRDLNRHYGDDRSQRNWQGDHDSNRNRDYRRDGDDRRSGSDRDRDRNWDRDRDRYRWRDDHGRYWYNERGWYDNYRADHFRYRDGRYFSRQRFSIGFYYAPWGYSPRFWLQNWWLPVSYYDDQYVIDDFWRFDLYEPPYGCRWIRVGNDALLVDRYTGDVVDVIYDLYW